MLNCPSSTRSLALNRISFTTPVVSTVRSTPRAAATVPIASMPGVQVTGSTFTVDTVSGTTGMLAK